LSGRDTWELRWLYPSPSMQQHRETIHGDFIDACEAARKKFKEVNRPVAVFGYSTVPWFAIDSNGELNRNTNAETRRS
jgi:hypothetical protein